jgi:DNA polymerase III alpha subunit (gram-positive type)
MYLIADLETTSIRASSAEILTADFIHLDENLNEVDKVSFKIRPRYWSKDADEASKIHGITREQAFSFDPYTVVIRAMFDYLLKFKSAHMVAHVNRMFNSSYDQTILRMHSLDNNLYFDFAQAFPERKYISTHSLAKFKEVPSKYDLASLCNYFNIKQNKHHSSEDDVRVTAQLFKILMNDTNLEEFYKFENKENTNESSNEVKRKPVKKR